MASTPTRDLPEEILAATRKSQETMIRAIRTWVETVRTVTPRLPSVPGPLADRLPKLPSVTDRLPTPEDVVASGYDFAEQWLAIQRKFAEDVLAATEPLIPGHGKRTWKDATRGDAVAPKPQVTPKLQVTPKPQVTQSAPKAAAPKAPTADSAPKATATTAPKAPAATAPKAPAAKATPKPATPKVAPKSAAPKPTSANATAKPATAKPAAPKSTAPKSTAPKSDPKPAAPRPAPKSTGTAETPSRPATAAK